MLGWVLIGAGLAYAAGRIFAGYPRPGAEFRHLAGRDVAFLNAAAEATFPAGGAIPSSGGEARTAIYTDRWLSVLPRRTKTLMRLLFFLMEHGTLILPAPGWGGWRRFTSLSPGQQVANLEAWRRSRLPPRRLAFVSLRAILTMAYFAHPPVLRQLRVAPLRLDRPVCEADLLWPPIGKGPEAIRFSRDDLTPPSDGRPVDLDGPLHPAYAEPRP